LLPIAGELNQQPKFGRICQLDPSSFYETVRAAIEGDAHDNSAPMDAPSRRMILDTILSERKL
jgi:hypothetical protein